MNCTFEASGRSAMKRTERATSPTSITGSTRTEPSACGTPWVILKAISVSALPMSIWPQAMSKGRPSSDSVRVSPVTACLDMV